MTAIVGDNNLSEESSAMINSAEFGSLEGSDLSKKSQAAFKALELA